MKILVVTLHDIMNFGAFMQAFAMKQVLEALGHKPVFLRINGWQHTKHRYKGYFSKRPMRLLTKFRRGLAYASHFNLLETTGSRSYAYPLAIVGSDELLNVNNTSFYHAEEYFGNSLRADRVCGYALSCGDATEEDIARVPGAVDGLRSMRWLSGRDARTVQVLENIVSRPVSKVVDPTLLYGGEYESEEPRERNYILVYAYHVAADHISQLRAFADQNKKELISLDWQRAWCDRVILASPRRALGLIRGADFVATDSLHGSIFSILFQKPFVCFATRGKVRALLEDFGLEERDGCGVASLRPLLHRETDWERVSRLIAGSRAESLQFLRRCLDVQSPPATG